MTTSLSNPYAQGTPEHRLWEHWHRAFFDQPVHGQLLSIEEQLRHTLCELLQLSDQLDPSQLRADTRTQLLEMESALDLLDEIAEHAFVQVIAPSPVTHH